MHLSLDRLQRLALLSVLLNGALVGLKYFLARMSGSTALLADAVHSATDVLASLMLFVGLRVSKRRDRRFPYGLYKIENLTSLFIAALILFAAYEILVQALRTSGPLELPAVPYALSGVAVAMAAAYLFSRYELKVARQERSPGLEADAQHIRTDLFSSAVILAGLAGSLFGFQLDRIAAVVVVVFVARAGLEVAVDAIRVLLDASIDFATLDRVKAIILAEPKVVEIKSLTGRNSGRFRFIEAEIVLRETDLKKAHRTSERIEKNVRKEVENVDHILIHYEPVSKTHLLCAVPLENPDGIMSEHFGDAPYFGLFSLDLRTRRATVELVEKNPFLGQERAKGIAVAEWLVQKGVDRVYVRSAFHGRGPVYVFSDAGVEVVSTEASDLRTVMEQAAEELSTQVEYQQD